MSEKGLRVEFRLPVRQKTGSGAPLTADRPVTEPESVPRIARLLAFAHKWEGMVRRGEVKDYAEMARWHGLSAARVTQICNLTLLAPDLQLQILQAPLAFDVAERDLRQVHADPVWDRQHDLWQLRGC